MELYETHYKIFYLGDLLQDTSYSDIDRMEIKSVARVRSGYLYAKKDNRLLTAIRVSKKRYEELGGMTLVDWLKGKISTQA